ncbi:MAG: TIGR00725 family protein, partial [archaeon]|nr:TIGR00725 family protein [archaeon]
MKQITVIGSGSDVSKEVWDMAEELGRGVAKRRAVLICGGKGGVMEAVCKGAKQERGLTVGILPGTVDEANRYVDIKIVTEMGDARNAIN